MIWLKIKNAVLFVWWVIFLIPVVPAVVISSVFVVYLFEEQSKPMLAHEKFFNSLVDRWGVLGEILGKNPGKLFGAAKRWARPIFLGA
jgi:hypothetical protein